MPTGTQTHKGYIHIDNTSTAFIFKPYIQSNYIFNAIPPGRMANLSQLTKIQRTVVALPVLSFPLAAFHSLLCSLAICVPPSLSLSQLFYLFQSQSLPLSPSFLLPCISGSVVQHTVFTVLRTASKSLGLRCGYYDNQVSIHSEAVCVCVRQRG